MSSASFVSTTECSEEVAKVLPTITLPSTLEDLKQPTSSLLRSPDESNLESREGRMACGIGRASGPPGNYIPRA